MCKNSATNSKYTLSSPRCVFKAQESFMQTFQAYRTMIHGNLSVDSMPCSGTIHDEIQF